MSPLRVPARNNSSLSSATNGCLDTLSSGALALLRPHLTVVAVDDGFVFWDGNFYPNTLFPVSGLVSITVSLASGENIEVAAIGREGAAAQFTPDPAGGTTQGCAFAGGDFIRIPTAELFAAARANEEIARLVHFCRDWLLTQSQQVAACNAVHSAEQRLCRWLAQSCQRLGSQTFHATQDEIASGLGIRRTTVTLLAQALQEKGLIRYRRGKIVVADQALVEKVACECCIALGEKYWPSTRLQKYSALRAHSPV